MIERLMNPEHPYGEPDYSRFSKHITDLRKQLQGQLDRKSQNLLEQLCNTYIRQGNAMLPDAFADGFWSAVELMLEYKKRNLL